MLRVELAILLLAPLPCDVAADDILAAVTTDRVDVVAARPERAAPELLLDGRHAQEYLTGGDALDRLDDLLRRVGRDRLDQKVDMVAVRPDLQERDLVAVADVKADPPQDRLHLLGDDGAAVLRGADRVVQQGRDVMTLVDVFAHTSTVYRMRSRAQTDRQGQIR